jgi:nucleoside-diphosphate-sugar epimerase
MKVAITGATGFVGAHLMEYLKNRGIEIIPFSRSTNFFKDVQCIMTNYSDSRIIQMHLQDVDVVVHLAGLAHQLDDKVGINEYIKANVDSTFVLAKASLEAQVKRFIYISSIAVNGGDTDRRKPFSEDDFPMPVTFYGQSKLIAEDRITNIFKGSSTDFVILRPPLIYGTECPGNFKKLLILSSYMRILPFGAISCQKSMISIQNFIDAIFHSMHSPESANQIFIVSDSETLPMNKLIDILMAEFHGPNAINMPISPDILSILAKMVGKQKQWLKFTSTLEVNSDKFCNMTNWTAPYTVREGLIESVKGFLSNA